MRSTKDGFIAGVNLQTW